MHHVVRSSSARRDRRGLRRGAAGLIAALCITTSTPVGAQDTTTSTTSPSSTTTPATAPPPTAPPPTAPPPTKPPSTTGPSTIAPSTTGPATTNPSDLVPSESVPEPVCAPNEVDPSTPPETAADGSELDPPCLPPLFDIDGDGILEEVTPDIDPGQSEDEADSPPPNVTVTIPPPNRFDNAIEWTPSVALVSDVETARAKLADAEARLTELVDEIRSFRLQRKELEAERAALDVESIETLLALEQAQERMRLRATTAFVAGDDVDFGGDPDLGRVPDDRAQQTIVDIIFEADRALIAAHEADRSAVANSIRQLVQRTRVAERSLALAEARVEEARADRGQAAEELKAFEAGSGVYISGVTFPIAWPYSVPLINSWGFPRSGGRRHEGIDIFAAAGTPLVAAERGVVTRIGNGTLGGLRLWLKGESGTDWYYAHLSGFAPGLSENQVVEVGELIGFVGNTGNAIGTPPHLHLQIHPNGGDPVNPYPLLKMVSDEEIEARSLAEAE